MGAIIHIGCMFLSHHTLTVHIHECIALALMFLQLQGDSSQQGLEGHCDMKKVEVSDVPKIKSEGCSQQERQTWLEIPIPRYTKVQHVLFEHTYINRMYKYTQWGKYTLQSSTKYTYKVTYVRMYICVCTYFTS